MKRRVVVTGSGMVSPLGVGVEENWDAICNGKSGIGLITRFDVEGFIKYVKSIRSTICGLMPILALMEICKMAGIKKGELLEYYTSGDVIKDYKNAVGYGSIVYEKK